MQISHSDINLQKALVLGCGGTGRKVVTQFMHLMKDNLLSDKYTDLEKEDILKTNFPIRCFGLDTSNQHDTNIDPDQKSDKNRLLETISINRKEYPYYIETINNTQYPPPSSNSQNEVVSVGENFMYPNNRQIINHILPFENDTSADVGSSGCPAKGRRMFLCSWESIYNEILVKIKDSFKGINEKVGFAENLTFNRGRQIKVFIVAGLGSGTGNGIHYDLAAMVKKAFTANNFSEIDITGIFFLPGFINNGVGEVYTPNCYSSLKDLDHFINGNPYNLKMGAGKTLSYSNTGNEYLFNKIFLNNNFNKNSHSDNGINIIKSMKMTSELMFHWLCTSMGGTIDARWTDITNTTNSENGKKTFYSSFGISTIRIPLAKIEIRLMSYYAKEMLNSLELYGDDKTEYEINLQRTLYKEFKEKINFKKIWEKYFDKNYILTKFKILEDNGRIDTRIKKLNENGSNKNRKIDGFIKECEDLYNRRVNEYGPECSDLVEILKKVFNEAIDELVIQGGPKNTLNHLIKDKILENRIKNYLDKLLKESLSWSDLSIDSLRHIDRDFEEIYNNRLERIKKDWSDYNERMYLPFSGKKKNLESIKGLISNLSKIIYDYYTIKFVKLIKYDIKKILDYQDADLKDLGNKFDAIRLILENRIEPKNSDSSISKDIFDIYNKEYIYNRIIDHENNYFKKSPDEMAEEIRREGIQLSAKEENIFIDDFDRKDAKTIAVALEKIARINYQKDIKEFNFSTFINMLKIGDKGQEDFKKIRKRIEAGMKFAIDDSAPYIKHDTCKTPSQKMSFFLEPEGKNSYPIEWRSKIEEVSGNKLGIDYRKEGNLPFSATILQFDVGFPLFKINILRKWKKDYDDYRFAVGFYANKKFWPINKFNIKMDDIFPKLTQPIILPSEKEINSYVDWAIKNIAQIPIFIKIYNPDDTIVYQLNIFYDGYPIAESDKYKIMEYYWGNYKYLDIAEILKILGNNVELVTQMLKIAVLFVNNMEDAKGKVYATHINDINNPQNKNSVRVESFFKLLDKMDPVDIRDFREESIIKNNAGNYFFNPKLFGENKEEVSKIFIETSKRKNIRNRTIKDIKDIISKDKVFFREFIKLIKVEFKDSSVKNGVQMPEGLRTYIDSIKDLVL